MIPAEAINFFYHIMLMLVKSIVLGFFKESKNNLYLHLSTNIADNKIKLPAIVIKYYFWRS
jgi:hypothetical protein